MNIKMKVREAGWLISGLVVAAGLTGGCMEGPTETTMGAVDPEHTIQFTPEVVAVLNASAEVGETISLNQYGEQNLFYDGNVNPLSGDVIAGLLEAEWQMMQANPATAADRFITDLRDRNGGPFSAETPLRLIDANYLNAHLMAMASNLSDNAHIRRPDKGSAMNRNFVQEWGQTQIDIGTYGVAGGVILIVGFPGVGTVGGVLVEVGSVYSLGLGYLLLRVGAAFEGGEILSDQIATAVYESGGGHDCTGHYSGRFVGTDSGSIEADLGRDGIFYSTFTYDSTGVPAELPVYVESDGTIQSPLAEAGHSGQFDFDTCKASGTWPGGTWQVTKE